MAQIKTVINTSANRCQRCNRQLKNPFARYGWRCAEILGVAQNLNYAGDGAFSTYTLGLNEANDFLRKSNIDIKKIDLVKFYESYAKLYLAVGMNNSYLRRLAYDDMRSSLSPGYDKNGKMIVTNPLSPTLRSYLAWFDDMDVANDRFTTTAFTDNRFNPYAFQLQILLNQNGTTDKFGNKLKEDGIFGPKTQWAADVAKGIIPSTGFINMLQTNITGVGVRTTLLKDNITKKYQLYDILSNQRLLEFDKHGLPNAKGTIIPDTPHMNIETTKNASPLQKQIATALNHRPIPTSVYKAFKNFDDVVKIVKSGGKAIAVAGIVLDTYELGSTIYLDLNDEDKKLGKKTIKTSIGIGGSYAGGFGGAKLGTMGGAAIGTAICPGLGTIIGGILGGIGGGIAGAIGGRTLGEYVVDKTYKEA